MTTPLRLGVDIGQAVDPTAMAAIHCLEERYEIRQLGRIALGTPYPKVAELICSAAVKMREADGRRKTAVAEQHFVTHRERITPEAASEITVYVDATGVGRPIVDMLAGPLMEANVQMVPVVMAAGDEMKEMVKDDRASGMYRYVRAGKEFMIGRLQALLQTQRVTGANNAEFEEMQNQLLAFQRRTTDQMRDTYGAKSGAHDDLVIALALAVLDDVPSNAAGLAELNAAIPGYGAEIHLEPPNLERDVPSFGRSTLGWKW